MGLFGFFRKKSAATPAPVVKPSGSKKPDAPRFSPEEIISELDKAGYFRYDVAADLPQLKAEIGAGISEDEYLPLVEKDSPKPHVIDIRHHHIDNEDLFEEYGIIKALEGMSGFFSKISVRMEVTEHFEEYDSKNQWVDQSLKLNGKPYVLFEHFKGYGWGEAAQRFADMVNNQLWLQDSEERLYLINGGNDGRAVFLTAPLYTLLRKYITDPNEQPMTTTDWCEKNDVEYLPVG